MKSFSFLADFIPALRYHKNQPLSFYPESIHSIILTEYLLHCFLCLFHSLSGLLFPSFLLSCSFFILQYLVFFCYPVMHPFEIVRHVDKLVIQVVFQLPAPPYILKPVMCHILFSLYSRIRSLFIPVVGIAPHAGILFSDRVSLTFLVYVPAELMERYPSVLLLQKICVAFKGFVKFL